MRATTSPNYTSKVYANEDTHVKREKDKKPSPKSLKKSPEQDHAGN